MCRINKRKKKSLVIVTVEETAATVIENVKRSSYSRQYMLKGVLMDKKGTEKVGGRIEGVELVAGSDTVMEFVCREWVDEVLIALPKETPFPETFYAYLLEMGVTVHLNLLRAAKLEGHRQNVKQIGDYTLLSNSYYRTSLKQTVCKRLMDIVGNSTLSAIFMGIRPAVVALIVAPVISSAKA
ncbi:MAG: sugar transferase, partial [Hungatella sp.]|nr:sugar transferase [Hungatella sp.]